jgi:2-polyprenyl-3-methyl-5-hydroxy-6-metoxy-1,4-benzoquinol methylase
MGSGQPRRFCTDEELDRIGYDGRTAAQDLEQWCCNGPRAETQELLDVILGEGVAGATVLDIGAGVGTVHMTLLEAGAARAVDVDASRDYIATARAEAERRGLATRIDYRYGDVVELAADLPPADIVTADAVICCYPHLAPLLAAATRSAPRLVGLSYINDTLWLRAWMRTQNVLWALRRRPDRWYIHRHATVDRLMADAGYAVIHDGGSWLGRVVVYRRATAR